MTPKEFKLPDLGEGIHEGEIMAVHVAPGDRVAEGDVILEVETDKATVEIPSPFTGVVTAVNVTAGDTVRVGQVLLVVDGDPSATEASEAEPPRAVAASPVAPGDLQEAPAPATRAPVSSESASPRQGLVPASPATRRLARELGVDLARVPASGPAELVTGEDVRNFAHTGEVKPESEPHTRKAPKATAPASADVDEAGIPPERIPYKSVRRAIGKQMNRAWAEIPHVTTQDEVDITRLELLRRRHVPWVKAQGGHLSLTVLMVKAAIRALKTYPNFNAQLDLEGGQDDAGAILRHRQYHIGIAVDTPDGLIVPVVRHGDRPNIVELSRILSDLVARTRARKVSLQELQGGTFTLTNVGRAGGTFFTPIINHPQVAILGMGGARIRPVVVKTAQGEFNTVPRLMLPLTLTIDHRVLDGADAGRFLNLLKHMLQEPEKLLLLM